MFYVRKSWNIFIAFKDERKRVGKNTHILYVYIYIYQNVLNIGIYIIHIYVFTV